MINKLIDKIKKTKAPIVVGLDPMLSYVPEHIQKKAFAEFGETIQAEVLADDIIGGTANGFKKEWNINGETVTLGVEKVK